MSSSRSSLCSERLKDSSRSSRRISAACWTLWFLPTWTFRPRCETEEKSHWSHLKPAFLCDLHQALVIGNKILQPFLLAPLPLLSSSSPCRALTGESTQHSTSPSPPSLRGEKDPQRPESHQKSRHWTFHNNLHVHLFISRPSLRHWRMWWWRQTLRWTVGWTKIGWKVCNDDGGYGGQGGGQGGGWVGGQGDKRWAGGRWAGG